MANEAADKIFNTFRLAAENKLEIKVDRLKGFIKWGKKNDHPSYLLDLANGHAEHGAIVKGKARYLTGLSIKSKSNSPNTEAFLKSANKKESWIEVREKLDQDEVLYGTYAVKILPNILGGPNEFFHVDFGKLRRSEDFTKWIYSDDWSDNQASRIEYPEFYEGCKVPSIYVGKFYNPTVKKIESAYPSPDYASCLLDIDTDKRASTFFNMLIQNNFSAGTLVTIFSKPEKDEKEWLVENLKGEHTGEANAGNILVSFVKPGSDAKGAEVVNLNANDLDKQYQEVSKRSQQKIIMGHNVPSVLFKLKSEGQLGNDRNEVDLFQELFINEYVKPKQKKFHKDLAYFYKLKFNQEDEFETEQFSLVGKEIPLDNQTVVDAINDIDANIIPKYLADRFGFEIPVLPQGQPAPTGVEQEINPHLKGLKGRERQDLAAVVRDFKKGRLNPEQAIMRARAFGFNEMDAKKYLGITMSAHDKEHLFFELFDKYAVDISDDEVIDVEFIAHSKEQALKMELKNHRFFLAQPLKVSVTELRNAILNQLKGNPTITAEELSANFGVEVSKIQSEIEWLSSKGLVESGPDGLLPTEKGFNKSTEPVETEIYTEYTYEKRDGVDADPPVKPTTRKLCADLWNKTRTQALTFEAIEKMENEFGESVWDFRGGFYNNGVETTPWCRHIWVGTTKIRRK